MQRRKIDHKQLHTDILRDMKQLGTICTTDDVCRGVGETYSVVYQALRELMVAGKVERIKNPFNQSIYWQLTKGTN